MRVIIVGGGQTGIEIASNLSQEHEIVIIEINNQVVKNLKNNKSLDLTVVKGNGASANVLEAARVKESDIIIAVTGIDEVNIIACMLGKKYGVQKTAARL